MSLLIIVLAITFIIGSMMWVLPSPRERHQMKLRQKAFRAGLRVQITKFNFKNIQEPINCIAYSLPFSREKKPQKTWEYYNKAIKHEDNHSIWQSEINQLNYANNEPLNNIELQYLDDILVKLPKDWLAVTQQLDSVVLYWQERGDEESVTQIVEILQTLHNMEGSI